MLLAGSMEVPHAAARTAGITASGPLATYLELERVANIPG